MRLAFAAVFYVFLYSLMPARAIFWLILPNAEGNVPLLQISLADIFMSQEWTTSFASSARSPYMRSFGMRPGSLRLTWPCHSKCPLLRIANRLYMLACTRHFGVGHFLFLANVRTLRKHLIWKLLIFSSYFA